MTMLLRMSDVVILTWSIAGVIGGAIGALAKVLAAILVSDRPPLAVSLEGATGR